MKRINFLENNLERVNYWLQFAEAKNAALIAFVVAMIAVINSLFENTVIMIMLIAIFCIALAISILSMFPKGYMESDKKNGDYDEDKDNYFYWADIAKYSKNDYIVKISNCFFEDESVEEIDKQELMLAEEIITNARIAKYKYKMFSYATKVVIFGIVLIPICSIIVA